MARTFTELAPRAYQPAVHWLAVATAAATFPVICLGGEVTSRGAGLSVPDWPTSYGFDMFLFPPSRWIGGILFEHTHRLAATVIGMLSIALVVAAFWPRRSRQKNRANRIFALAVLGGVLFQGILGGLRVIWKDLDLAIVHACVAQAFFCLAACAALVSSHWWISAPALSNTPGAPAGRRLIRWGMISVAVVYGQLIIGAIMRHEEAGLAIPDLPLAYGKWLPPLTAAGLKAANHARTWIWKLPPVTLGQIWLHFGHRLGAAAVTIALVSLIVLALRGRKHERIQGVSALAKTLAALLLLQLTLGILTVLMRKPFEIASAHVATGALVLLTTFLLTARAYRLYHPRLSPTASHPQSAMHRPIKTPELAPA